MNFVDPDGRFPDIIWDVASIGMGVRNLVQNLQSGNVRDAVEDGVGIVIDVFAAAVPFVPGGVGVIRNSAKVVGIMDDTIDATKVVKLEDAAKKVENASEFVHGNSKLSTKAQHAYDIIDTETNTIVKTGVSGGKIRKSDGKSYRAEQQVRKWNKEENTNKYKSIITHIEPEGIGSRDRILEYERKRAHYLRDMNQLDINKHITP